MPLSPTPDPHGAPRDRVLVVDKDADTVASLGLLLELSGFAVCSAGDGETALAVAGEFRPCVVVTDLALPRLDGLGLIDRLNALPPEDRPAVVVMTGWTGAAARDRLVQARVEAVVIKPADPAELTGLLREVCAEKARARDTRRRSGDAAAPTKPLLDQATRLAEGKSRDTPRQV